MPITFTTVNAINSLDWVAPPNPAISPPTNRPVKFKFKVGDIVEHKTNKVYTGEVVSVRISGYSEKSAITRIVVNGSYYEFYERDLKIKGPPLTHSEKLVVKINQLYERQEWVTEGKPSALSCITPPALSVEKRDQIALETTLQSTQMDIPFVSEDTESYLQGSWEAYQIDIQRQAAAIPSTQRGLNQAIGQARSPMHPMRGSRNT